MEWTIDGNDIALSQHILQILHTTASNLLLELRREWLVVEVKQLLAVERLQSPQNALSDTANSDGTDDLVLEIVLTLRNGSDIPVSRCDLLVRRDEVADEDEDGHDDVLGDRNDIGSSDFGDSDTAIGLVGGIKVDVIRPNASGDGELEVLGFGKAFSGQVAGMEAVV